MSEHRENGVAEPAGGEELAGGTMGLVTRVGDRVLRPTGPWTPTVHRLLEHLREAGLAEVPRPHGVTADGREELDFIPGQVGVYPLEPWVWSAQILDDAARLLRRVHDASLDLLTAWPETWPAVWRMPTHEPAEVVCHNDVAPYNLVQRDGRVVGLIDWDVASPGPRVWDLAYLAYRIVPLVGDDRDGAPPLSRRPARLRALIEAYGPVGDALIEPPVVVRTAADRLDDLAAFTLRRAEDGGPAELFDHVELYRRDRAWILRSAL